MLRREDPFMDQQLSGLIKELNDISSDVSQYTAFLTQRNRVMHHFELSARSLDN